MTEAYDVFLSFKNLADDGQPTRDSVIAQELYEHLTKQGVSVFFSKVSLERRGITAYKKAIDDALESTSILIAVGTSKGNLESQWVRYEWDGFINDILTGAKPNGRILTYVQDVAVSSLPRALRQYTVIRHGPGSLDQLSNYIVNGFDEEGGPKKPAEPEVAALRPPGSATHEVYICYASEDQAMADALCASLERKQIRCWIAPRDVAIGTEYGAAIVNAIRSSQVFVPVLSSHLNESDFAMREIDLAVDAKIPILPLQVEELKLKPHLQFSIGSIQCFVVRTPQQLDNFAIYAQARLREMPGKSATS